MNVCVCAGVCACVTLDGCCGAGRAWLQLVNWLGATPLTGGDAIAAFTCAGTDAAAYKDCASAGDAGARLRCWLRCGAHKQPPPTPDARCRSCPVVAARTTQAPRACAPSCHSACTQTLPAAACRPRLRSDPSSSWTSSKRQSTASTRPCGAAAAARATRDRCANWEAATKTQQRMQMHACRRRGAWTP